MKTKLKNMLHEGEVLVTFTKKDGIDRKMRCTLQEDVIPMSKLPKERVEGEERHLSDEVCRVWDLESEGWRSFRWDSIKSFV
jgi:hypothetical protein